VGGKWLGGMGLGGSAEKVAEKTQGEGKAAKNGSRKALVSVECCLGLSQAKDERLGWKRI